MSARSGAAPVAGARPRAVETLDRALADWLSAFTAPAALAGEMADACASGAAWPAAVAAVAAREAGWDDAEAMAWGIAVGAQAGALEAARRSLEAEGGVDGAARPADGPAVALLASDALVAAAHEALSSLSPDRFAEALAALERGFGDGGPWRALPDGIGRPAWRSTIPLALAPLGDVEPADELAGLVRAARERASSSPSSARPASPGDGA